MGLKLIIGFIKVLRTSGDGTNKATPCMLRNVIPLHRLQDKSSSIAEERPRISRSLPIESSLTC